MALNKSLYKGKRELTMAQFEALSSIDENVDYNITDYPDNGMTNAQLVETLDYGRLFNVGYITICLDDGVFRKGHILQLQVVDNVRIWKDITATSALDIDDLAKLGGLPLGAIIPIAMVTNDPYVQPLDGRNLSQTGIYADFCTWLKNRLNEDANNVPICTIDEYASDMATYGQCGKFVINDTNKDISCDFHVVRANSIKLPTITEFIASNNGGDAIGLAQLDEFKSHNHYIPDYADVGGTNDPESLKVNSGINTITGYYSVYTHNTGGEETRPKNIRYPYYIVVATATKTDVQVNLDNVANDINNINTILSRTEQVETIYDMNSNNPDINLGKIGGLGDEESISKDVSKFKKLICTYNYSANSATFIVDLTTTGTAYGMGLGGIAYDNYGTNLGLFSGKIIVNDARNLIQVSIFNAFQGGYNDSYGHISKIEGVY